jgi:hypothetical protein
MRSRQFLVTMFDVVIMPLPFFASGSRGDPGAPSNPLSGGARHLPVSIVFA